ncbi:MAG: hypothetical protein ABW098_03750 [Candidatus Thiodiazotropha sp.]
MEINSAYSSALLSEASYANFQTAINPDGSFNEGRVITALVDLNGKVDPDDGFSPTQADDFITHWRVAHHLPNTSTGFSATVFESLDSPGKYVFAIRGTEPVFVRTPEKNVARKHVVTKLIIEK